MRFEHLLTAVRGLRPADEPTKLELVRRIEGAKWLLWHGRQERCLQRLDALRRDTGWAGSRNPLGKLIKYLRGFPDWLINYGKRYHEDRPISTSGAEPAVDYVIGQRMKKKGHMRWSRERRAGRCCRCAARCSTDTTCGTSSGGIHRSGGS